MSRARSLTTLLLVASLAMLTGCAADAPKPSATKEADTCASYLAQSDDERESDAGYLIGDALVEYGPDGATFVPDGERLDAACAEGSDRTVDMAADIANRAVSDDPTCADYLALAPEVQASWADALIQEYEFDLGIDEATLPGALILGCGTTPYHDPPDDLAGSARALFLFQHNDETAFAAFLAGAPAGAPRLNGAVTKAFKITDRDGYTFDLTISYSFTQPTNDPAAQKPGYTDVRLGLSDGTITITNTTPQRELSFKSVNGIVSPLDQPVVAVVAVYPADDPVCVAARAASAPSRPCAMQVMFGRIASTIPATGTLDLTTYRGGRGFDPGVSAIPEAQYAAVAASVPFPKSLIVIYSAGDTSRFTGKTVCGDAQYLAIIGNVGPDGCSTLTYLSQPLT